VRSTIMRAVPSRTRLAAGAAAVLAALLVAAGAIHFTGGEDKPMSRKQFEKTAREQMPDPPDGAGGVKAVDIGQGFQEPDGVFAPPGVGDPIYVIERSGRIWRLSRGRKQLFLDLRRYVRSASPEQGLLSMVFAPDFRRSRRFYVYFSDRSKNIRVQEFRAPTSSGSTVDPGTRRQILHVEHPASKPGVKLGDQVHYAGQMLFGPDGKLYIAIGEGGPQLRPTLRAQSLRTLLGKIIRIDPRPSGSKQYTVPGDNPLVGRAGARPEIWAYGLRNPWRFSFDDLGNLWIGDVGRTGTEEIDFATPAQARGANFGWPCFEGIRRVRHCNPPHWIRPAIKRPRVSKACSSIIGGYVVRDPALASLRGRYVYTDLCDGYLRSAKAVGSRVVDDRKVGLQVPWTASLGEDGLGRIYAAGFANGHVFRLEPQ
jgi:glucose/arabinose dehydrogenase